VGAVADENVEALIEDPDEALRQWYRGFMAPAGEGNVLTGGPIPPIGQIGEIFDRWLERRQDQLRVAICEKLRYAQLNSNKREAVEISTVAVVSAALLSTHFAAQIDPVATAVVLLSRRSLDRLCDARDEAADD
jgi:hypothetical protein